MVTVWDANEQAKRSFPDETAAMETSRRFFIRVTLKLRESVRDVHEPNSSPSGSASALCLTNPRETLRAVRCHGRSRRRLREPNHIAE